MRIHNFLPLLLDCLKAWEKIPSEKQFNDRYLSAVGPLLQPMLDDFSSFRGYGFYEYVKKEVDWAPYRTHALKLDSSKEEVRLKRCITRVEELLGVKLAGETVLFGAFSMMDGYARFERGSHRVFLGVDEDCGVSNYLDILITHELTHVARESQSGVWTGYGLDPKMSHDEFVKVQPVIEHLMGEGFSCAVSEILNPKEDAWNFAYQTQDSYKDIVRNGKKVAEKVHRELKDPKGYYRNLYDTEGYGVQAEWFVHYVWAWHWVKHLIRDRCNGDPKQLVGKCSKEFRDDALGFII